MQKITKRLALAVALALACATFLAGCGGNITSFQPSKNLPTWQLDGKYVEEEPDEEQTIDGVKNIYVTESDGPDYVVSSMPNEGNETVQEYASRMAELFDAKCETAVLDGVEVVRYSYRMEWKGQKRNATDTFMLDGDTMWTVTQYDKGDSVQSTQ